MFVLRYPRVASLLSAVLSFAAGELPAQTIVVSGGQFSSALQSAAASAPAGATLVVRAGSYFGPRIDRPLTVLCDPGVILLESSRIQPCLLVEGIPAGTALFWRGGRLQPQGLGSNPDIAVASCAGFVHLEGLTTDPNAQSSARAGSVFRDCASVILQRCQLRRIDLVRSRAALADCAISGAAAAQTAELSAALLAIDAELEIAGGLVEGANVIHPFLPGIPGVALLATNTATRLAGSGLELRSGLPRNLPAIQSDAGSLWLDPRVITTSNAPQSIVGTTVIQMRSQPALSLSFDAVAKVVSLEVRGEAQALYGVHYAISPQPVIATPFGGWWLGSSSLFLMGGAFPAGGNVAVSFPLPPLPEPVPIVYQALQLTTALELTLSPGVGLVNG